MPFSKIFPNLDNINVFSASLEILILAIVFYRLILIIKGSRAESVARSFVVLIAIFLLSNFLKFHTMSWILEKVLILSFFALPVVFQPEIRRGLEKMGRAFLWTKEFEILHDEEKEKIISSVADTAYYLANQKIGALIAIEKSMKLDGFVEGGVIIDAKVKEEILSQIFTPPGPLHDGAVVIRGEKIYLARCFFPLTDNPNVEVGLGSRHRAAIGLAETTDAIVVVISEGTSEISIAHAGRLTKIPDKKTFLEIAMALLATSYTYQEKGNK